MIKNQVYLYHAGELDELAKDGKVYCLEMPGVRAYLTEWQVVPQILSCARGYSGYGQTIEVLLKMPSNRTTGRPLSAVETRGVKKAEIMNFFKKPGFLERLLEEFRYIYFQG